MSIVVNHQFAVGKASNIQLNCIGADLACSPERRDRVLGLAP
jgi:hypothetical protein